VLLLLGIGFLAGVVTGVSPCILPVLPVIVAGGATGQDRRRPYAIIAGLVVSFSIFTLVGGSLLSLLGLPQDALRDAAIVVLLALGVGLIVPTFGDLLERPFARLGGRRQAGGGSGFVLGLSLGLLFVPCAGPILATVSVVATRHKVGWETVFVTLSYALGAAVPLLGFAVLSRRTVNGSALLRTHGPLVRRVAGIVLVLATLAFFFNDYTKVFKNLLPSYTTAFQQHVENSNAVEKQLRALTGEKATKATSAAAQGAGLPDLGPAPAFTGITQWLNTPGDEPLTLSSLRGKVVLVDFWTYSCINCQRTLPHLEAWERAYSADGLVIIGVHTPEFPFEHVVSNVAAAAAQLGVNYPIAIDNNDATWLAYSNEYWPAEYLIDQQGVIRHTEFGEGNYALSEALIRQLLVAGGAKNLPAPTDVPDRTPSESTTPETYLGTQRIDDYVGTPIDPDVSARYQFPSSLPANGVSFSGNWTVSDWSALAGSAAEIRLSFTADDVYLVLGGDGTVQVRVNGVAEETLEVNGVPRLYTLVAGSTLRSGLLQLDVSPGVSAYDFTFG
jgi:cytochrome c biogenesis protein CcdA/thiol-disulfide isomerase/thioredoxin